MWLNSQKTELLLQWLRGTTVPMLASRPDGEILWVNEAFENLVGYASSELIGKISWLELTTTVSDATNDADMANEMVSGIRQDYSFRKSYRHKSGEPRPCSVHVMRYPSVGEFQCCLVSVVPLDAGQDMFHQLELIHLRITELMAKPSSFEAMIEVSKKHPIIASVVAMVLASLLFGDRVLELFEHAAGIVK